MAANKKTTKSRIRKGQPPPPEANGMPADASRNASGPPTFPNPCSATRLPVMVSPTLICALACPATAGETASMETTMADSAVRIRGMRVLDSPSRQKSPSLRNRVLARDMVPQDLVGAVAFFAGAESAFITGQTLVVDGGAYYH